ncbi:MAG TPA: histidine kinase [Luteimonas sp.]|nr:histidine kinase [Luteimonas sp.]
MFARLDPTRLLRYAGLFTWAVVGLPLLLLSLPPDPAVEAGEDVAVAVVLGWQAWLAWATFGFSYGWLTRTLTVRRASALDYVLLLLLTGSAIAISYYSASGLGSILLMVLACVLPWLLPLGVGVALLVLCEFVIVPVYVRGLGMYWVEAVMQAVLYVGVTGFVFVTSMVARQQAQARDEQRRLNAELRATRALLAESARVNERTRISRELHDLLGHHLTALSLNLEVASHLTQGQAHEHVGQAHTLARLLLSDVREAVSQIRGDDAIDMAATLLPLADNVPGLRIDMAMPRPFLLDDPERAHVLLRCTQEIITNAVRHAHAQVLRLRYGWDGQAIRLQARDDGRGAEAPSAGNGLAGMRERLATYGGDLETETAPGQGFTLRLCLPLAPGSRFGGPPAPQPLPEA